MEKTYNKLNLLRNDGVIIRVPFIVKGRLVVMRPVARLEARLKFTNQHVSTIGVYPEDRRNELRDNILARGVSGVFPLGQCERVYAGMPHDGMRVLGELVDWKNA